MDWYTIRVFKNLNLMWFICTDEKSAIFGNMFSDCIDFGTATKVDNITDSILQSASG